MKYCGKKFKLVEVIILIKLITIQLLLKSKFVNNGIQKINLERIFVSPDDNRLVENAFAYIYLII